MISRNAANDLLRAFSEQLGINPLELDDDNCCAIADGDQTAMHLFFDEDKGCFLFVGFVCSMPEDEEDYASMARTLLLSHLYFRETEGATFALEPENEYVLMQRYWNSDNVTVESMQQAVEQFIDLLHFWQDRLNAPIEPEEESPVETAYMMV